MTKTELIQLIEAYGRACYREGSTNMGLDATVAWIAVERAVNELIPASMYLQVTDAMEYSSGKDGMEFSPEEWAAALLRDAKLYREQQGEVLSPSSIELPEQETLEMHDSVMKVLYHGVTRTRTNDLWQAYLKVLREMPSVSKQRWPKTKRVGRLEDMSPTGRLEVMTDSDGDVIVVITTGTTVDDFQQASVEFCTSCGGGGGSPKTRQALINLMVAMEDDNADRAARRYKVPGEE